MCAKKTSILSLLLLIISPFADSQVMNVDYKVTIEFPFGSRYVEEILLSEIDKNIKDESHVDRIGDAFSKGKIVQYDFAIDMTLDQYSPRQFLIQDYQPKSFNSDPAVDAFIDRKTTYEFDGAEFRIRKTRMAGDVERRRVEKLIVKPVDHERQEVDHVHDFALQRFLSAYKELKLLRTVEKFKDVTSYSYPDGRSFNRSRIGDALMLEVVSLNRYSERIVSNYEFLYVNQKPVLQSLVYEYPSSYTLRIEQEGFMIREGISETNMEDWR